MNRVCQRKGTDSQPERQPVCSASYQAFIGHRWPGSSTCRADACGQRGPANASSICRRASSGWFIACAAGTATRGAFGSGGSFRAKSVCASALATARSGSKSALTVALVSARCAGRGCGSTEAYWRMWGQDEDGPQARPARPSAGRAVEVNGESLGQELKHAISPVQTGDSRADLPPKRDCARYCIALSVHRAERIWIRFWRGLDGLNACNSSAAHPGNFGYFCFGCLAFHSR